MEVVERAEGPFSRRNVQEWSRLDQLTGLLEHARVETDHWTASTSNSSHHFGKVVDSRSRSLAGGGQEQRQQTKQLEVFQASVPGGSVQVIRSSTSSTRQTHKVLSGGSGWIASDRLAIPSSENQGFDHLKLTLNPLDLSSQKTRASVGRSGSIGSRRPPSRPRSITSTKNEDVPEQVDGRQLTELSKKFHQEPQQDSILVRDSPILNGFSSDHNDNISNDKAKESQRYETTSSLINSLSSNVSNCKPTILKSHHLSLIRKKSCSSEDLHVVDEEGNDTDSNTSEWKRSSKVRRSLQFPPKPSQVQKETIVIPVTKSVSEIKKEIENRKQLVTSSFRTNQWEHFSELEGVLGAVKNGIREDDLSKDSSNSSDAGTISSSKTKKRQTFITVESLKEVKGRLRKLNSPDDEVLKNDDVDDGIVTEVRSSSPTVEVIDDTPKSSVKSYVFGMEVMLRKSKPAFIGTGSLESRTTNKSLTNGNNRSEEWYNRRKSYGFEQVGNQQNNDYSSFEKSKIESSTDSGICRSSDTFSSWQKLEKSTTNQSGPIKTSHSIVIKPYLTSKNNSSEVEVDAVVQKGRKTVVNLTSNTSNPSWTWRTENSDPNHSEMHKENLPGGKIADVIKSLREKSTSGNQRLSDPITISIPIQQTTKSNLTDSTSLLLKQSTPLGAVETSNTSLPNELTPYSELLYGKDTAETSTHENKSYFENIPWRGSRTKALSNFFDSEFKRHSIAVDQTKYLTHKKTYGSYCFDENNESDDKERKCEFQRNSLDIFNHNDKEINKGGESDHEMNCNEKKQKKVEFCKTEVHFAAEPGRFNIVETDGKPPPSNMFRRRRKTTSDAPNRNGLPEIRFGDTQYEKNMLSINEKVSPSQNLTAFRSSPLMYNNDENDSIPSTYSTIETKPTTTATTLENEFSKQIQEEQTYSEDDTPKPRSILKNNIPKPKSYLLGECPDVLIGEESKSWGVKLKSVKVEDESPKWDQDPQSPKETEFQKLLKSLRPATNKPPDLFELPSQMKQSSTATDNGLEVRITSSTFPPDLRRASWSVADRIKSVEEAKGYSTKVNFGPQETTVVKLDDLSSCLTPSQGLKSSWLIKEQNSTFDVRPAEQLKSGKKLMYSQSFNTTASQSLLVNHKNNSSKHVFKSTSLVMEVQNPNINHLGEFEKKISARETSTNLTRDICEKNSQRLKESSKQQRNSTSEKVERYSQELNTMLKDDGKKLFSFEINTKTIPPVRKTSSATQTYFVTRSLLRKDSSQEKLKTVGKENESMNIIPGVLNDLDDLSRCIDEVIIDSPQRLHNKDCSSSKSVFKVKEDFKRVPSPDNIHDVAANKPTMMSQLDLLRGIVDLEELSEDSLKADEEVRVYMSADNDEDSEWSGSWSRVRAFRQEASKDMDSRTSPRVGSTAHPPLNHRQGADAVNSTSGPPRVTSVALLHPDTDTKLPATARPLPRFADNHPSPTSSSYTSKNLLNSSGISSKVELSTNGERTWSFSKGLEDDSTVTTNKINESDFLGLPSEQSNHKITSLVLRDNSSPSKFSKNSQSPSKEALFLERSAERNILYNDENNRQMSSSPTSGTSRKVTSSVNIKLEAYQNNLGKTEPNYLVRPFNNRMVKEVNQNHPINVSTHKLEEKVEFSKKIEMKNPSNDVKSKERKLSSSSSGRDGWLNTPKEVQVRRKVEHIVRPQSSKKESKVSERTKKANSLKPIHKRTESPIYQNREIYTERQDSNDNTETESTILEELTKAADQILLAVNGYTDDDSFRASSEDECRKKRENFSNQPLCTISEVPNKKNNITKNSSRQSMGVIKSTRSNDLRREFRTSSKGKSGITSSNSSMESVPIPDVRPILSSEDRNKRRAARLLQRASSRELLFQSAASSSEDIGSGSDTSSLRTKRVFRRPRVHNGKQSTSATANESRTSERVQRTTASTEAHKNLRTKVQTENRCSRHSKTTSGSASGVRRERRPAVVTHGSRTQKKTPETSQSVRKSGTVSQAK